MDRHPWLRTPDELSDDCIVRPLRQTQRLARMNGWTIQQADDLVAWRDGLGVGHQWTWQQITAVEFLRWLRENGRISG
jgi:hypothetical protein